MTVHLWTRTDGNALYGGMWDDGDFTFSEMNVGGGGIPLHQVTNDNDIWWDFSDMKIKATGKFAVDLTGCYVAVWDNQNAILDGHYPITASDADSITIATDISGAAGGGAADVGPTVGGAFDVYIGGATLAATAADLFTVSSIIEMENDAQYVIDDNDCIMEITLSTAIETGSMIRGFGTSPGDGTQAILNAGTNSLADVILCPNADGIAFVDLRLTGASDCGLDGAALANYIHLYNVTIDACDYGVKGYHQWVISNCTMHTCGTAIYLGWALHLSDCKVYGMITAGVYAWSAIVLNNLFYNIVGYSLQISSQYKWSAIIGNTFDGDNTANTVAAYLDNTSTYQMLLIENNVFYDFDRAIKSDSLIDNDACKQFFRNNCFNSNTNANTNIDATGFDAVTAAPAFENEGTRDYTPGLLSPLRGAATDGGDIGAIQRDEDYPAIGNVTEDDTSDGETGTYHEATEAEVQDTVQFGEDGTEYTGSYAGGGGGGSPVFNSSIFG